MNKYKGKICPFCKTSFLEDDEVVECDICEMPHHKDCWIENGQCTTFGCTGKIKGMLPYEANNVAPQNAAPAQQPFTPNPIPQQARVVPPVVQQPIAQNPAPQAQTQQAPAFCIYCGNKHNPGDMFCRKCGKKIQGAVAPLTPEEQNKRQYEQAIKLLEASRFDEALQIFTRLADYSDAKEKAKLCVQGKENAQKERLYLGAIAVLGKQRVSDTEIKTAIETLSSLSDYKDAKSKISDLEKMLEKWYEAKKAAEEAARKRQYETAVSYVNSGLFDEAIKIFTDLGEYADCKAQIEKTLEAKETARKEQLYTKSVAVLTAESLTEAELKEAIESLKSIEDYKDSKEKIPEVEARLEKWYEDKAAAEEAERIRKAKAKAKAKKITILSSIVAMFVAIIVVGIIFVTKTYSIVYDLDGGTIESANESSYTLLTNDITLCKPTKEGYTFIGWTGTDLDTPTLDVTIPKWSLGNRDYTATWQANSYTITFDTVGGVGSESQNVTFDANTELPTPTKEGYTFAGWYVGDKLYSNGDWKDASDITLTAKWTANSYNITFENTSEILPGIVVTFNPNYRGATSTTTTLTNGQKLNYPTNPTRSGYVFTGWYTNSNCTTKYNFSGNITANMTLYAGWQTLTITNNSSYAWSTSGGVLTSTNKGSSSSSEYRITATAPVTITFEYKTSSESGYDYLYIKKNGSTLKSCSGTTSYVSYSVTLATGDYLSFVYSKDGSGSKGSDCAYIFNLTYTSTATQTSTAKANCTTNITYEYTNGKKYTQSATFDDEQTLPVPTRRGYAFLGWYIGDTKVESGVWKYSADVTLTAKWEVGGNTITLDANGGTVSSNSVAVIYDKAFTLPTPTRTGYTFDGWYSGTTKYESGTWREVDNVTLVAKWMANSYNVTFDDITEVKANVVITLNPNYSGAFSTTVTLANGQTFNYPTVPTRSGYAFVGWYTDRSCTTKYNFSGTITENITLYAKWYSMASSYNTRKYVDIANYNSTSSKKTFSASASYSSSQDYYYFTCYTTGSYTIYANRTSGDFYITVYNATQGSTIISKYNMYSGYSSKSASFSANAGDIIYISFYKYSSSDSAGAGTFYVSGASYPTSSATVSCNTVEGYVYDSTSNVSETVAFGNTVTLPTPIRTGYSFLGWYNGKTKVESGAWGIASNVTLTPQWDAAKNTITLDAKGGTVSSTTVSVTYGVAYTLPAPERTGYTFDGWFSGSTRYTSGTWNEEADVTLEAKWTAKTYNITYTDVEEVRAEVQVTLDHNYSGSTPSVITLNNGETFDYPAVPKRIGYAFVGWYTNSSCTTKYDFSGSITEDITLYAKWTAMTSSYSSREYIDIAKYNSSSTPKSVTVSATSSSSQNYYYFTCYKSGSYTLYANRTSGDYYITVYNVTQSSTVMSKYNLYGSYTSKSASFTANAGDVIYVCLYNYSGNSSGGCSFYVSGITYPTSTATVSGYVYDTSSDCSATVAFGSNYTPPTPIRTGYAFLGWYNGNTKIEAGAWNIDSNVTLVPRWDVRTNTITLDPNGGTVSNSSISVTYGESYTLPTLTRTGYSFDGWFSGSTKYTSGTWNGQTNITLVAQWTVKTYNLTLSNTERKDIVVTFDNNYSGSTPTTVTLEDGETLSYPTEPTRNGYAFTGWFTNSSCTTRYNFNGTISDDMTLYAGWKKISFTYQYTKVEVDPTEYTSSSDYLGLSTSGTSSTYKRYVYFVAEEAGTHYIYYANSTSSSSYKYYLYIYNLTTGSTIKSNATVSSTSYTSASFTCAAGDVIVMEVYKYSTSSYYDSTAYFYFGGFSSVTSSAVAESDDYLYSSTSNYSEQVTYNTTFTLPTPTRTGYRFLGWYNGNNKVVAGTWNYDNNLTLTPKWEEIVYYKVTFNNTAQVVDKVKVTYNYNYSGSTNTVVELSDGDTLTYPTVPTRSGYAFVGWYTDSSCKTRFNFNETITEDITLYAEWYAMQSTYTVREYVDIANYNTSSSKKSFSNVTSQSIRNYYYFTTYVTGTYTFYANYSSGDYYISLYNATQGTYILNDTNFWSYGTKSKSVTYTANAGDIIYVGVYKYSSSSSTGSGTFYVSGASYPTSSAKAQCAETDNIEYSYGNSVTIQVGYGEEFTLPTLTRAGYTFLGWYNGSTKVESGTWNIASNVTLTPKWQ